MAQFISQETINSNSFGFLMNLHNAYILSFTFPVNYIMLLWVRWKETGDLSSEFQENYKQKYFLLLTSLSLIFWQSCEQWTFVCCNVISCFPLDVRKNRNIAKVTEDSGCYSRNIFRKGPCLVLYEPRTDIWLATHKGLWSVLYSYSAEQAQLDRKATVIVVTTLISAALSTQQGHSSFLF